MQAPILDSFEAEMGAAVRVGKVDVDEQGELAARYGISSIPCLILFKNGQVAHKMVGSMPKARLVSELEANL
jgi:thioredoxin 1